MKKRYKMGKDKRTYKKIKEITEPIFNLAAYNCNRNYSISGHNSKRAELSMLALVEYMQNVGKKKK